MSRRTAAFCDNIVRRRIGQGLEYHFGHEMSDLHAGRYGCRKLAVDHRTFGGGHLDRPNGAFINWNIGVKGTFDRHKDISVGKIIDHVAAPIHLGRCAVKINVNVTVFNFHGEFDTDIFSLAGAFDDAFIRIDTIRNPADSLSHAFFSPVNDFIGQVIQCIQAFILQHFNDL